MTTSLRDKWDARYRDASDEPSACYALREFAHLLPASGSALDLACGRGGNALLLAGHGLQTQAWDLSPVAIQHLQTIAAERGLSLQTEARDVIAEPPMADSFDVIVVSYFLERTLAEKIAAAVKPGGLLFYETFIRDKPAGVGPSNPDYLLGKNELLQLFSALDVIAYREEGTHGELSQGFRNAAMLVARKSV